MEFEPTLASQGSAKPSQTNAENAADMGRNPHVATVQALNNAYPNGWRSGHDTTDGMTVILATGVRLMAEAMFGRKAGT